VLLLRCLRSLVPLVVAFALPALTGCGGGEHATATRHAAPPPNPNAPLPLEEAEQFLRARGFSGIAESTAHYRPRQPLKAIVAIREGAADVPGYQTFFFVGDRFVGTDTPDMSAAIQTVDQKPDRVTFAYTLYRPSDPGMSIPTGGTARVTYRWDGRRIVALDPIPSAVWGAPLSRR
jgi:LppP/LprE lipoprotein